MARIEKKRPTDWVSSGYFVGWEKKDGVRWAVIAVPEDFEGPEHAVQEAERWLADREKENRRQRQLRKESAVGEPDVNQADLDSVDGL